MSSVALLGAEAQCHSVFETFRMKVTIFAHDGRTMPRLERGFLCLPNDRYWPLGDAHCQEITVVREAASDPKRTFATQPDSANIDPAQYA